ncbi:MAG TPA: tetratricopeptide repeat protein [Smithella sp.]|nr:tetratricopeptide repeat protein [Smithella sp.]HNY49264.1 tetratricopeptide repeat protein [Smithella sp.]HOG88951.1 tetratricopeptide repeat protein [Smithella sp.]
MNPPPFLMMTEDKNTKKNLAENLLRQGQYHEAIALMEEIHKEAPEEESVLLMMSWAYYDSGDTGKAMEYLNVLLERELSRKVFTGFAFDELVRMYKQEKQFGKLVEICERAVAVQPEDVGLLNELGNAYYESRRYTQATEIYKKLIEMEDDNPAFYCLWGNALFANGLYQESELAYRKAGAIDSENADRYYFKMAVLFQQAGKHQDAERLFHQCLKMNPSHSLYLCALGDSLVVLGQMQKALVAYEKAVELDRASAGSYYNRLGNSLMNAGNFSQAAEAFQSAIQCEPDRHYYLNLARAYREMGRTAEAEMIVREVNKLV